jgi:predicted nuclease with TOPRIM domain
MLNSNTEVISRKVVLFQSEILELKKRVSELLTEKAILEKEISSLRENMAEVRQENTDLQEIVYDLNKENNHLKSRVEQLLETASHAIVVTEPIADIQTEKIESKAPVQITPDPIEQKKKEAELEKQLFEYERNATIPDYFHFESDENNFDSGEQD